MAKKKKFASANLKTKQPKATATSVTSQQQQKQPSKELPSSNNYPIFENVASSLSDQEKLCLLKSEFDQHTNSECLEDIFSSFNNDYDSSRQVIQELFPQPTTTTTTATTFTDPNNNNNSNNNSTNAKPGSTSRSNNNNVYEDFYSEKNSLSNTSSSASKNALHNSADYYFENSSATTFLQITPDIFSRLHDQFGTNNTQACVPIVAKDFETQGTFLLPLDECDGAILYKNLVRFIQRSNFGAIATTMYDEDDDDLVSYDGSTSTSAISSCSSFSTSTHHGLSSLASARNIENAATAAAGTSYQHDPVSYASLYSLTNSNETVDLKEIMEMQSALDASRADYLRELTDKARYFRGSDSEAAAIAQELCIERKRDFLFAKFPGADRLQLDALFEINCYNLNETLRDVEAFYNFKLPKFYQNSLYSEIVIQNNESKFAFDGMDDELRQLMAADQEDAASALGLGLFEENENDIEDETIANRLSDRQFKNRINELFENRQQWHLKISHLRQKSAHFCNQKQYAISTLYSNEIAKCYNELGKLSEEIVDTYTEYSHPNNTIDLHGLIMKEVRQIVPKILQQFQNKFFPQNCAATELHHPQHLSGSSRPGTPLPDTIKRVAKLKFITGIGSNSGNGFGWIRNYLLNFICKKSLRFQSDGPGAFIIIMSNRNLIDF